MAPTSRNKPARSGPGRGTPRSRTTARPEKRIGSGRANTRRLGPQEPETEVPEPATTPQLPAASKAMSLTWRLLVVAVVLALIVVSLAQSLRVYFEQAGDIAELRSEIQHSRELNADLQDQIERWEDPDYVEALARERLGWVMPGETGYQVIGADGEALTADEQAFQDQDQTLDGPWFERMWTSIALADKPAEQATDSKNQSSDEVPIIEPDATPSAEETP